MYQRSALIYAMRGVLNDGEVQEWQLLIFLGRQCQDQVTSDIFSEIIWGDIYDRTVDLFQASLVLRIEGVVIGVNIPLIAQEFPSQHTTVNYACNIHFQYIVLLLLHEHVVSLAG